MTIDFTEQLIDEICGYISEGKSLRQIEAIDGMPSKASILRRLAKDEDFDTKCARARRVQGELAADEHNDIINELRAGTMPSDIGRAVLSGLEWRAKKLEPKKYGDKVDFTTAGKPINDIKTIDAKLAQLCGKAGIDFSAGDEGEV
jgi:hypothetical protein